MNEIWATITDFPNYKISNYGNVKNEKKILKQHIIQSGYSGIFLYNNEIKHKRV